MSQMGHDGREWTDKGESILSPKNLMAVERHLEDVGPIVVEHWHYYGASTPTHLAFDSFDQFKAYLGSHVKPGDAIDVWPFPTNIGAAIARAKYPDMEGRVPVGLAFSASRYTRDDATALAAYRQPVSTRTIRGRMKVSSGNTSVGVDR